ncbi:MAG: excinuclease ABC subunit UvrB [Firmicutes bacterium]|nr:excinuclease ABC subunit UvrB [Bacillota bacterium]
MIFNLQAPFEPRGDQIEAIKILVQNFNTHKQQVLLGATGTGKTYTMANIIQTLGKKTLVLAPNKTLAGQLYAELKAFFPNNRVEYFISYYDYYQPEAYVVGKDLYIEKDASINDEIDELRHSATSSLLERDDVIVVASVSCIYGIGDPEDYQGSMLVLRKGDKIGRDGILNELVHMTYERNDIDFHRGTFRVRGDVIEIIPAYEHAHGIRVSLFGKEIDSIKRFDVLTGQTIDQMEMMTLFPASHFVTDKEKLQESIRRIKNELQDQILYFKERNLLLEAQRIEQRTKYDIEMMTEIGFCSGIENYARHLALREAGETPSTLIDFFGKDFLMIIDESHVTMPQIRGMYFGDRSRKTTLVDHGFRLPSALDNRPLQFEEFEHKVDKVVYLSATPGDYELEKKLPVVEQIIRPTYLLDPIVEVRKTMGQMDDLFFEIQERTKKNERVLVTTLTIRMSEDLTAYFKKMGLKVAYLHSEIKSLERIQILTDLRKGIYDVLIGINLLREGLDLPEVSLVAILDADKQGFLRSERSLVQTIGRAARNQNGRVILYADSMSSAMDYAIKETDRRRKKQQDFNETHGTEPITIQKAIRDDISIRQVIGEDKVKKVMNKENKKKLIREIEKAMLDAAKALDFERAAELRDALMELKSS